MAQSIGNYIRKAMPGEVDWRVRLLNAWERITGTIGTQVRLEKIEEELLVIGVYDACWMQELYLLTPVLLGIINQNLDRPRIKQLRFKRAGKRERKQQPLPRKGQVWKDPEYRLTRIEQTALTHITDPQLRDALARYRARCAWTNVL